ncbi:MAG TPA: hypothetical protein VFP61_12630 [Acidimicrobiales bacterium]|nr:hypothetical protein [Acidimicrobiales bacterium]
MAGTVTIAEAAEQAGIPREDVVLLLHRGELRAVPDAAGLPVVDVASLEASMASRVG